MPNALTRTAAAIVLTAGALLLQGCQKDATYSGGCLSGANGCRVSSPCTRLAFTCSATPGSLQAHVLSATDTPQHVGDMLGATGDIMLENDQAVAVIAGLGNQNYLDPHGGSILDLYNRGYSDDGINQVLQVTGILPADAVHYTAYELINEPDRVGVQLKGALDGHPGVSVYTLYEMRSCDPGVRIRTEIVNGTPDTQLWALSDGFYWSSGEALPFTPEAGGGFDHPSFGLTTINGAFTKYPFLAASTHAPPYASYAMVGCNQSLMEGFNSVTVSTAGLPRTVVPPRGFQVYERFLAVAKSGDVAGAAGIALEARKQLYKEGYVTLTGQVQRAGALELGNERDTSILISEGKLTTAPGQRVPWSQVVPDPSGAFSARVPAGKGYVVEVYAFGQKQAERELPTVSGDLALDPFVLPSTARVNLTVLDANGGKPINAEIFVVPADDATRAATTGSLHGQFDTCAPWLGPPPGPSPACNRILTSNTGAVSVEVPAGSFHFYATRGPFWTLGHQVVTLTPTSADLTFTLQRLPLQPDGTLSADLHVHGAASFDSSIPDLDRVRSFSASDMQVIAATDHDVVHDYGSVVQMLGLGDQLSTIDGMETTGHIPFLYVPGYGFPLVIGHYNFWPLKYDPTLPRNGGPDDELLEPGQLFDAMDGHWANNVPVIELNHPWAPSTFGRDLGFPRAIGMSLLKNLPAADDGTRNGVYVRARGRLHNNDHHAQEVMNGSSNDIYLPYRAFWFYTLNQGQLKAGTANSDSHSLTDSTLGTPRNVVYTDTPSGPSFDVDRFNAAIRAGAVLGTNGPVIEATMDAASGGVVGFGHPPSGQVMFGLTPFQPAPNAKLHLKVSAAPWVPVQEIRIVVNGQVVKKIAIPDDPARDPFGTSGLLRYQGDLALSELVSGTRDAWLVVEAGRPLMLAGDLGGGLDGEQDGVPDTTDNNGDGVVDKSDIGPGLDVGPLNNPPVPTSFTDPQFHFSVVVTGGYPAAFTNPFVMDLDGNGRFDAPGVPGGY